ncbi:MAG: OmpA family protein [Ruminococcaceae bacterium]|nr:OmpA family protein [Oscillospiraceae bacterium]
MAKLPPKKQEGNSQEWLNTYADMVTLLLTFFVLLFASSNLDESKMQFIVQAFQNHGKFVNTVVSKPNPDDNATDITGVTNSSQDGGGDGTMPQSFDEMYQYLAEFIDDNNLSDSVSIENSAAYFTLRFNSAVFFEPNQAILKAEGKEMLMKFSPYIHALDSHIKTLTVTGHTAFDNNPAVSDWTLSSSRASSVTNYLHTGMGTSVIEEQKYRTRGCGNTEPIASNDTADGRQQNRRVELVMLKDVEDPMDSKVLQDIIKHDYGIEGEPIDINNPGNIKDPTTLPEGSVDKVIANITDRFKDDGSASAGNMGPGAVDGSMFIASDSSESSSGAAAAGDGDQSE